MAGEDLPGRLAHVRWIGGGSGAGKSTVAARLAAEHGFRLYDTDASIRSHLERSSPATHPLLHRFAAMTMDERWVGRSPMEMLETFHGFQGEAFEMIVEDVARLPAGTPVLVEGFRLLPRLVAPLLNARSRAVWLLPSPEFRRRALLERGTTLPMLSTTSDPSKAFENLLERDHLFTQLVAKEAASLALQAIAIEVQDEPDDVAERVRRALGL